MTDVARNPDGTFPKGVSGNPRGRPPSKKNRITELKQDLELAIRQNVSRRDIQDIVEAMVFEAKEGSIGAARLILDKFLPNAKDTDDAAGDGATFVFRVENATVVAKNTEPEPIEGEIITTEESNGQAEP